MLILRDLTFDEELEQFVHRNKLSLLLMTTKNTSIVEGFSKQESRDFSDRYRHNCFTYSILSSEYFIESCCYLDN